MELPEALDGKLPAPRGDEPASLRQDIVDELSDHLQCSLDRELVGASDINQAWQNVLSRFGKPSLIARQLWFDWMKETMMMQRLLLAMSLAMMFTCLFVGWVAWSVSEKSQRTNHEFLEKLTNLSLNKTVVVAQVKEWVPGKLRLVTSDGQPVLKGFSVQLRSPERLNYSSGLKFGKVTIKNKKDGVFDLGLLRRRVYEVRIASSWNEQITINIDTRLASSIDTTIVCPRAPLPKALLAIKVDWPEDLKQRNLSLGCSFSQDSPHRPELDGNSWVNQNTRGFQLLVTSDGRFISTLNSTHAVFLPFRFYGENDGKLSFRGSYFNKSTHFYGDGSVVLDPQIQLWAGKYRMISMTVLPDASTVKTVEELPTESLARVVFHLPTKSRRPARQPTDYRLDMPSIYSDFEIRAGENNVWKITLPPKFVDFIRQQKS